MTISEAHNRFYFYLDKVGSPYISRQETDRVLQQAERKYLQMQVNPNRENAFEGLVANTERLSHLVVSVQAPAGNTGELKYLDIRAAIPPVSISREGTAYSTASSFYIYKFLSVARYCPQLTATPTTNPAMKVNFGGKDTKSVANTDDKFVLSKYIRHGDYFKLIANSFKVLTDKNPGHRYFADALQFYPMTTAEVALSLIRYPVPMSYDRNLVEEVNDMELAPGAAAIDPEWDNESMDDIIAIAAQLAGVSIRDADLIQGGEILKRKE